MHCLWILMSTGMCSLWCKFRNINIFILWFLLLCIQYSSKRQDECPSVCSRSSHSPSHSIWLLVDYTQACCLCFSPGMTDLKASFNYVSSRAATSSRMLEYPHCWQLLEYDFSYPNIRPQKKKNPGHLALSRPTFTRARESACRWHGTVGKNCFPAQSFSNSPLRNWDQMSRFLFGLGGKWIILPSLVFKTAMFTVIIIIKSAPECMSFSETDLGYCSRGMVVAPTKITKINLKKKKHGVRIFEYSLVSLGVYSGTSLHGCAQP